MLKDGNVHKHCVTRNVSYWWNIKMSVKQTREYYDNVFVARSCQKDILIMVYMLI